jgi:Uncharacterized homolog of phage Mu protein gp47
VSVGSELQKHTYAYIERLMLDSISNKVDKRQGSIIFDTTAPCAYAIADFFMNLYQNYQETYILTASGDNLENRAIEFGIERFQATAAVKRADFADADGNPVAVAVGSRFSTVSTTTPVIYKVIESYKDFGGAQVSGAYQLQCETLGIVGNEYFGNLITINFLPQVKAATISTTLVPGQDIESDSSLRERYLLRVNERPFGGNVAQYREMLLEIGGVGAVQVYPVWDGGGTVKLVVVDSDFNAVSAEFIDYLQELICPVDKQEDSARGLGLAPIGHEVSIVTANEILVDVETTITLATNFVLSQVLSSVKEAIRNYIGEVRAVWGVADESNNYLVTVYQSKINAAVVSVDGVVSVQNTLINGLDSDFELITSNNASQIPKAGEVNIHG